MTWREVVSRIITVALALGFAVGSVIFGAWAGKLVDAGLSAAIGPVQSRATGYVVLTTLLVCLWDVWRGRRQSR